MRLLLVENATHFPSYAGGSKSDQLMIAALARRGHECRIVARLDDETRRSPEQYAGALIDRGVAPISAADGVVVFALDSVDVHAVTSANLRLYVLKQVETFKPDLVVVSTDPLNILVHDLVRVQARKTVYLARTTHLLPFGPDSSFVSDVKTDAIRQARAVVTVSRYLAEYIQRHSGIDAVHRPIQMMDSANWPNLGSVENTFVTMVNPCALKGISIFTGLAELFEDVAFAAVPTWGTTARDRAELAAHANISVLEPVDDIRDLLRQTRVTLVPSLWCEGRGRVVVESMLSGVPVLASDVGGIREAVMGIPCLLPVTPIARYERRVDERMIRVPETLAQDLGPWRDALARLLEDRDHYSRMSASSREAAMRYAGALDIGPFESLLQHCVSTS